MKTLILPLLLVALGVSMAPAIHAADDPKPAEGAKIKTLVVGGGSSHDFNKWFNVADLKTLNESGIATATYTDKPDTVLAALKDLDVLYLSNNQAMPGDDLRKGVFDFLESGKGILLVHAATWYNWGDWKEYNRVIVGGGTHGHDKYGEFEVTVDDPAHPIMAGLPATFKIKDELYHYEHDAKGTDIKVLATGKSPIDGKTYPVVFIVQSPKGRTVGITLGHDGAAHNLPAYQSLLTNSLKWLTQK